MAVPCWTDSRVLPNIRERSIPIISVEARIQFIVILHEEVKVSIVIEVSPNRIPEGESFWVDSCQERNRCKGRRYQSFSGLAVSTFRFQNDPVRVG